MTTGGKTRLALDPGRAVCDECTPYLALRAAMRSAGIPSPFDAWLSSGGG